MGQDYIEGISLCCFLLGFIVRAMSTVPQCSVNVFPSLMKKQHLYCLFCFLLGFILRALNTFPAETLPQCSVSVSFFCFAKNETLYQFVKALLNTFSVSCSKISSMNASSTLLRSNVASKSLKKLKFCVHSSSSPPSPALLV